MGLIGLTAGLPGRVAGVLVLAGVAVHTLGEILQAAGSFELRYGLAPAHAQGEYAGVTKLGNGLADAAGPSVLGFLCLGWGAPGWLVVGGVFAVIGLAVPRVVRWAERERLAPAG
jgi:hypothetical protein